MIPAETDIAIIGGGLSGLAIADGLTSLGLNWQLLDARDRLGGRVLSMAAGEGRFDLGPAWLWPHNGRLLALAQRFGLGVHGQHAQGNLVFEDANGAIRRDLSFAMMGDALRLAGGLGALTSALASGLDPSRVQTGALVEEIDTSGALLKLSGQGTGGPFRLNARTCVLALPPRLWAQNVALMPSLPEAARAALTGIPTWMAGHAKVVAVYDRPFWRAAGLSGDAISHAGPLMELHDATDEASGTPAIFGFVQPGAAGPDLSEAAQAQLVRLFGPEAAHPRHLLVKDWAADPATAIAADRVLPEGHPRYGIPQTVTAALDPRLILAGTETTAEDGGFLEGALAAAEQVLQHLADQAAPRGVAH